MEPYVQNSHRRLQTDRRGEEVGKKYLNILWQKISQNALQIKKPWIFHPNLGNAHSHVGFCGFELKLINRKRIIYKFQQNDGTRENLIRRKSETKRKKK